jgi:hypothetical protein
MRVRCKLTIQYESEHKAELINEIIKVDNEEYIKSKVNKNKIIADAEMSDNILSLLYTIDDFLLFLDFIMRIMNRIELKQ